MRNYDKNNLYLCCIENYLQYPDRKFSLRKGLVHNGNYFSSFLKINKNSFFDLLTGEYYIDGESPKVKVILKLDIESNKKDVPKKEISKVTEKCYKMIVSNRI